MIVCVSGCMCSGSGEIEAIGHVSGKHIVFNIDPTLKEKLENERVDYQLAREFIEWPDLDQKKRLKYELMKNIMTRRYFYHHPFYSNTL